MDSPDCMNNAAAIGIPAAGSSSKVSFMLVVDPAVMNSADNNLAANWVFSTNVYDVEGSQLGTPGLQNDVTTSAHDLAPLESQVSLFPNPGSTNVTINTAIKGNYRATLYDVMGKRVNTISLTKNNIDVSQLPLGLYILKLDFEEGSVTKRLVIQR